MSNNNAIRTIGTGLLAVGLMFAQDAVKPDNTKMNKGDGDKSAMTADKQKMNATDTKITQEIRKSLMADKALSTYAHNVKLITTNGKVTLKGPVRSEDEKKTIAMKAAAVAGPDNVIDEITIQAPSQ